MCVCVLEISVFESNKFSSRNEQSSLIRKQNDGNYNKKSIFAINK